MIVNFCVKFKKRNAEFSERKTHGKTTGIKASLLCTKILFIKKDKETEEKVYWKCDFFLKFKC